jgi:primosomal protein N' (replication factor Y) (superfamily II helicase)
MNFVDVLFPVNLGPLTYRYKDTLSGSIRPGVVVAAPLKNTIAKGIVIEKSATIPSGQAKEIKEVQGYAPLLSINMIELLKWMSEYYAAEQGLVLKSMLPMEAFKQVKKRHGKNRKIRGYSVDICDVDSSISDAVIDSINKNKYRAFLLHVPSSVYEYSFIIRLLAEIKNVIIVLPELFLINNLYPLLNEMFGERVCLYHSELSSGTRCESIERILKGHADIVLGTRSAVFAPLREVSLIAVLHEHSDSYKQESTPCYSGRDVAVMRAFFEKTTVLLSSFCPSVNSLFNCQWGKYTLLKPADNAEKPKIRIIDMRHEKLSRPYLSKTVTDNSLKYISNDKKAMFVINRRGYSTLLQCMDCNYIEECPNCRIPLVFHKHDMIMKCHYCDYTLKNIPDRCGRCYGYNLKLLGAGTQRIQEDIEELMGIKTLRFDSDMARKKSDLKEMMGDIFNDDRKIVIGTKIMTGKIGRGRGFSMAAILNTDISLNMPDFRSAERIFQEILSLADRIDPDGTIFIQTRMPQHYLYKYLKNYDYTSFIREELKRRRSLRYPPYSRLILMKITAKRNLSKDLSEIVKRTDKTIEALGPYLSRCIKDKLEFKILLKSLSREKLHSAARIFIEEFKNVKDVKIRVDVDPVKI